MCTQLTRDNFERIHNKFCRALHILVLRQSLMVQNYTVAIRIDHIFDEKTGTMMQAFHRSKPDLKHYGKIMTKYIQLTKQTN